MSRDPGLCPPEPDPAVRWQLRLLGAVVVHNAAQRIERFPSRAVAALLARLALLPDRAHPREELIELLWPGVAPAVGRNRLRQALSTLKSLLEPAGVPGAAVVQADRLMLRLVPLSLRCDAVVFEQHLRAGRIAEASRAWGGDLMPGFYDEWVEVERKRLALLHDTLPAHGGHMPAARPASDAPPAVREAAAAPPLAAAPLPTYLTRLFGVDVAAAHLRALVLQQRLVTLLGPGGSGKTRLGVEVAHALAVAPAVPFDRIAFVALVACHTRAELLAAITRTLHLPPSGELATLLAGQRVLLLLDNFEQLVDAGAIALGELLAQLPRLHLLVTSRRALGLDGETCVRTQALQLPEALASLAEAAANPAVALFADRARAARADFHVGERNQAAIVALVRALAGMPLAIELAASRVRSFAPAEMLAMLTGGSAAAGAHLALLARSGPRSGHDARHASMAQVIAWSWRLLDTPGRQLMHALTLFPADACTAAVAAVVGLPLAATALQLDALVAHSLLRCEQAADGAGARFGLVAPVREFVLTQSDSAERAPALPRAVQQQRLVDWLTAWADSLGPAPAPSRVDAELPLVHALLAEAPPAQAWKLALALRSYWDSDGLPGHVQAALERGLASLPPGPGVQRAQAHELLAYLRFEAGFAAEALRHAEAALAAAPDPAQRARALVRRAWVLLASGRGDYSAGTAPEQVGGWLEEALVLARSAGDLEAQARALHQLAVLVSHLGADFRRAERLLEESQSLWLALGDRRKAQARLRNRAQCWVRLGRQADALVAYKMCEQAARDEGDWVGQIDSLLSLATLQAQQRQWQQALDTNRRCVALCWQRWHRHGLAYALWNPPRLLARLRRPEAAIRLMGFAATYWQRCFGPLGDADRREQRAVRGLVRAQIGAARSEALWIEGAAMEVAAAVALALGE